MLEKDFTHEKSLRTAFALARVAHVARARERRSPKGQGLLRKEGPTSYDILLENLVLSQFTRFLKRFPRAFNKSHPYPASLRPFLVTPHPTVKMIMWMMILKYSICTYMYDVHCTSQEFTPRFKKFCSAKVYYFKAFKEQHILLRRAPIPSFEHAIGEAFRLSASRHDIWSQLENENSRLNPLMYTALDKLVFLPFS